jgi:hypothetical protein
VNVCSLAFSQTVYVAGVHGIHGVHQAVFAVPLCLGLGSRFWVHRVHKFGRRLSEAREGTMRKGQRAGGQKKGGTRGREAVPGWEYVEVLSGEGAKTHWRYFGGVVKPWCT